MGSISELIRREVFRRDKQSCLKCGRNIDLHVHHILPRYLGGTDELNNLSTLCAACHKEWHSIECHDFNYYDWLKYPPLIRIIAVFKSVEKNPEFFQNISGLELIETLNKVHKITSKDFDYFCGE